MRLYELHLLYNCDLSTEQAQEALKKLGDLIVKNGGKTLKTNLGELLVLKYKIKKSNVARYAYISMEYDPKAIAELDHTLRLTMDIHRHMINHVETEKEASPVSFEIVNEKDYRNRTSEYWMEHATFRQPNILRIFTTERGKILPRKSVAYISKFDNDAFMRQLKNQIKIARKMAWLPYF